jgi:large subunit ribosomal protein L23
MQDLYKVIYTPVVTEKSVRAMEEDNVYTFLVNTRANKLEIAGAIEKLWDVSVQDVRTMKYAGKMKRANIGKAAKSRAMGRRPAFKKAVVQLAEGDSIEFYEVG